MLGEYEQAKPVLAPQIMASRQARCNQAR